MPNFRTTINTVCLQVADRIVDLVNSFASIHFSKLQTHEIALYPPEYSHDPASNLHRARIRVALLPRETTPTEPTPPGAASPVTDAFLHGSMAGPATPAYKQLIEERSGFLPGMAPPPIEMRESWDRIVSQYPCLEAYLDFGVVDPSQQALQQIQLGNPTAPNVDLNPASGNLYIPPPDTRDFPQKNNPVFPPHRQHDSITPTPFTDNRPRYHQPVPWTDAENAHPLTDLIDMRNMVALNTGVRPDTVRCSREALELAGRTKEVCNHPWTGRLQDNPIPCIAAEVMQLIQAVTHLTVVTDDSLPDNQVVVESVSSTTPPPPPIQPPLAPVIPKPQNTHNPLTDLEAKMNTPAKPTPPPVPPPIPPDTDTRE